MYKKYFIGYKNGFTLIEIIASISLLVMVISVFLPIFPQIMSWTNQADDELVTSNLLGQVAHEVENNHTFGDGIPECETESPKLENDAYNINNKSYPVKLRVCMEEDVPLIRTNIRIFTPDGNRKLSETYTYVPIQSDGDTDG